MYMAPRWHQETIASRALKMNETRFVGKMLPKRVKVLSLGAWEYAGTIRNGYSFAHAKYNANP